MKFGDSLFQRSVPAWRRYNIDYTSIKKFIKVHTTPGSGKAVDIPGRGNTFEDDLFDIFVREHERVTLFVKSKLYEVNSRLESIDRQLAKLQQPRFRTKAHQNGIAVRKKLSKVEAEVLHVGEEIQNVARFISTNRLAIRKLVKKYKKWTRSASLGQRVNDQILKSPESFCNLDLAPALHRYAHYLDVTRASFTEGAPFMTQSGSRPASKGSRSQHESSETILKLLQGCSMEFDSAMNAPLPGQESQQAVYWVHPDNLLELRVLLLQQLRPVKLGQGGTRKKPQTEREFVAEALVGDLDALVRSHNATPKGAMDRLSMIQSKCAVARWTTGTNALITCPKSSDQRYGFEVVRVRKSQLRSFANQDMNLPSPDVIASSDEESNFSTKGLAELQAARSRFLENSNVAPIAHSSFKRSRFSGLQNTSTFGVWVSLDEDVKFDELSQETLQTSSENLAPRISFPYAILTLRGEGDGDDLIRILDRTHLTERVRGFSILKHAVASCCKPIGMRDPHWFSTLKKDIRHIPSTPLSLSRSNSSNPGLSSGSKQTSTTSTSDGPVTPVDSQVISISNATAPKYWNEYDNPEDEENSFYLYVNPNEALFPGQHTMQRWGQQIRGLFSKQDRGNAPQADAPSPTSSHDETSPLIETHLDGSANTTTEIMPPSEDVTSSSSDDEDMHSSSRRTKRVEQRTLSRTPTQSYGTVSRPDPAVDTIAAAAQQSSVASRHHQPSIGLIFVCLVLSLLVLAIGVVLLLAASMVRTSPEPLAVNWFAIIAVIISLALAVVGIGEFAGISFCFWRKDRVERRAVLVDPETGLVEAEAAEPSPPGSGSEQQNRHGVASILLMTLIGVVLFVGNVWVLAGAVAG